MAEKLAEKPSDKKQESKKRKRERILIIALTVVFAVLASVEFKLTKLSSTLPFVNSIFFFGLINFNIIILVALIWLIFKNVGKLFFERRSRLLGARLKTKLVVAFIGFSIIPTLTLFLISSLYINQSFDKWFSLKILDTFQSSLEISNLYYKNAENTSTHFAELISKEIPSRAKIKNFNIEYLRSLYALNAVEIYFDPLTSPIVALDPESRINNPNVYTRLTQDRLQKAFNGSRFSFIQNMGYADLVRSCVPMIDYTSGKVRAVVVVDTLIPINLTAKAGKIAHTAQDYKDINPLKYPIKTTYFSILILITLMIIFSEIWLGLFLARQLTVPVESLVKAAKEVGRGRLDVSIEKVGNDEISILVESFNKMTADLKENQFKLRQRTQQLEAILSNIATGVMLIDQHGNILTLNNSAKQLLNLDTNNLDYFNRPMKDVFTEEDHHALLYALSAGLNDLPQSEREQSWSSRINGEVKNLNAVATPLKENGVIWGAVAVLEDLTVIVKGQREVAWREVAKRIAHEIKNPLTPIKLSAQRIQRRLRELSGRDGQLVQECTSVIIQHTDELKEMVNEFSNFARLPEISPQPTQLNEVIQEAMTLYLTAHPEIHFITNLETRLPLINLDKDQIKRVMLNLIENAIGAIKLEVKTGPGRIQIGTHYNEKLEMAAITIKDNGPGMTAEIQERMFEPYFSTKKEGTGLGLAIVKRIINDHGGYIRVTSQPGQGSTFYIELPIKRVKLVS